MDGILSVSCHVGIYQETRTELDRLELGGFQGQEVYIVLWCKDRTAEHDCRADGQGVTIRSSHPYLGKTVARVRIPVGAFNNSLIRKYELLFFLFYIN